jgi:hypothetical protein
VLVELVLVVGWARGGSRGLLSLLRKPAEALSRTTVISFTSCFFLFDAEGSIVFYIFFRSFK